MRETNKTELNTLDEADFVRDVLKAQKPFVRFALIAICSPVVLGLATPTKNC